MKKLALILTLAICATFAHAQTTVVVQRPGLLTDLAGVAGALVAAPVIAAEGIVTGAVEATGALLHGTTNVYVVSQTQTVVTTPSIVTTAPIVTEVVPAPVVVPPPRLPVSTTTITTTTVGYGGTVTTTVTRPTSGYERVIPQYPPRTNIVVPVDPAHRVGPSPHVNPYVYRYRP